MWTSVGDLEIGDRLLQRDDDTITITAIAAVDQDKPFTVYNFTVDGIYNYYATSVDTLVHNCSKATVTFDGGHASVRVNYGSESLRTHQTGGMVQLPNGETISTPIQVEEFGGSASDAARTVTFDLLNPGGALACQETMMGRGILGDYDPANASCFHHCAAVLNAGGVSGVPHTGTTKDIVAFLLKAARGR